MALSILLIACGAFAFVASAQPVRTAKGMLRHLAAHPARARALGAAAWLAGAALALASRGPAIGLTLACVTAMAALAMTAIALPLIAAAPPLLARARSGKRSI